MHLNNSYGPEVKSKLSTALLFLLLYLTSILMGPNICNLEVDFSNIWENFIKLAEVNVQHFLSVMNQFKPLKNDHGNNMKFTGTLTKFLERKMMNCFKTFIFFFYPVFSRDIIVCVILKKWDQNVDYPKEGKLANQGVSHSALPFKTVTLSLLTKCFQCAYTWHCPIARVKTDYF